MKAKKFLVLLLVAIFAVSVALVSSCGKAKPSELILATTTSTADSGLLDVLTPEFEKQYNVTLKAIAVGTGEALKMGERGDADVLLVHSKAAEDEFVRKGFGLERVQVMNNDFIVVGPPTDPAGIKGGAGGVEALKKIAAKGATFVSRSDDSGTNKAEIKLWAEAGIEPSGKPWYIKTGQGMGETLTITNEKQGYTLADSATYLSMKQSLQLVILVEGDKDLFNQYGVIVVNPEKHLTLKLNVEGAGDFVEFLTNKEGQDLIGSYKKNGFALFYPNAKGETRGMGSYKEK